MIRIGFTKLERVVLYGLISFLIGIIYLSIVIIKRFEIL